MEKYVKKLTPAIRSQILMELSAPGCVVPKLAKAYGVSEVTIYNLRKEQGKQRVVSAADKFVELSLEPLKETRLEKASLTFSEFSLSIEGRIKSASLISIIKILEEAC